MECWPVYICPLPFRWHSIWVQTGRTMHAVYCAKSMIFNLVVGLAAAAFGIGISRFLPGWLGADPSLQADASAYFAIWSASLPF